MLIEKDQELLEVPILKDNIDTDSLNTIDTSRSIDKVIQKIDPQADSIQIDSNNSKVSRYEVFDALVHGGIGVNVHYIPIHTQPFYLEMGFTYGDFPIAETYYKNAISLPLFSQMSFEEQDKVVATLSKALQ